MKNGEKPAMPIRNDVELGDKPGWVDGLSKREYFAALAMQGLVTATQEDGQWAHDAVCSAQTAVEYADALLMELEK